MCNDVSMNTSETYSPEWIAGWFAGRLPEGWFTAAPSVTVDGRQILVVGTLAGPELPEGAAADFKAAAEAGRIARFREATRPERIAIAREAQRRFDLPVTWGATCGATTITFTPGGSGGPRAGGHELRAELRRRRAWRRGLHAPWAPAPWGWGPVPWAWRAGDVRDL
jgi:hypothetical protein